MAGKIDCEPLTPLEYTLVRVQMPLHWQLFYDLLWATGVRVSELLDLKKSDIGEQRILVRRLKRQNKVEEWIPIAFDLMERLRWHMRESKRETLFPYTRQAAWLALRDAAQKARLRPLHPHLFRHGFGRRVAKMDLGLSSLDHLVVLQRMLGHSSTRHTWRYINPGKDDVEGAWGKLQKGLE